MITVNLELKCQVLLSKVKLYLGNTHYHYTIYKNR